MASKWKIPMFLLLASLAAFTIFSIGLFFPLSFEFSIESGFKMSEGWQAYVTGIGSLLSGLGTVGLCFVAISEFKGFKDQKDKMFITKEYFDVIFEFDFSLIKLIESIKYFRSPLIGEGESEKLSSMTEYDAFEDIRVKLIVFRFDNERSLFNDFWINALKIEMFPDDQIGVKLKKIDEKIRKVFHYLGTLKYMSHRLTGSSLEKLETFIDRDRSQEFEDELMNLRDDLKESLKSLMKMTI